MLDLPVISKGVRSQRFPNTPVLNKPVEIVGGVWINCRLPDGSVISGGNIAQLIYYVDVIRIDGESAVLQEVQYIWVGRGVLGEVTEAMIATARLAIPVGSLELTDVMWCQWRSGSEIILPEEEI